MVRVIVAAALAVIRSGLRSIIGSVPGWSVVAAPTDLGALMEAIRGAPVDVVVLSVAFDGQDGADVLRQLRCRFPKLPVLIFSPDGSSDEALRLLRNGAYGYVVRESDRDEIIEAIREVGTGRPFVSRLVRGEMLERLLRGTKQPHERFSAREFEIFRLLARGHSPSEIARSLNLSVKTISTYRRRILDKTGLRTNADLVAYAIRHGLV